MLMRKTVMGLASVVVLAMASVGAAQTKPMAPGSSESHEHGSAQEPAESPYMSMMTPEMMAMMCARMGHQMEHRMMGMGMGPGMMGASDPKAQARMLRFRADLMKAMSDVMLKHAAELEKAK
jgi:hypothetical protein